MKTMIEETVNSIIPPHFLSIGNFISYDSNKLYTVCHNQISLGGKPIPPFDESSYKTIKS